MQQLGSPTIVSGGLSGLTCVSGQVRLFQFFTTPTPGSVIGQLTTFTGQTIPLVQTGVTPLGGIALSSVNNQFATLCGVFTQRGGQTVFDVRVVNPGAPSPTGTPINIQQLIQLLQFLAFLQSIGLGGFGKGFGGFGKGLGGLGKGLGGFGKGLTGLGTGIGGLQ